MNYARERQLKYNCPVVSQLTPRPYQFGSLMLISSREQPLGQTDSQTDKHIPIVECIVK